MKLSRIEWQKHYEFSLELFFVNIFISECDFGTGLQLNYSRWKSWSTVQKFNMQIMIDCRQKMGSTLYTHQQKIHNTKWVTIVMDNSAFLYNISQ